MEMLWHVERKVMKQFLLALLCIAISPGALLADPWKNESGHGRGGPLPWAGRGGEPPDWARGRGVWDGHYKHGPPVVRHDLYPPPVCMDQRFFPQYVPAVPYAWGRGRDWEDYEDRWQDAREREREAFLEWREQSREREQEQRERQREAFQEWQEWQRERGRSGR